MQAIPLRNTRGLGRNRWFRARHAMVQEWPDRIDLDVVSSRPVIPGPIRLEMNPQDALDLGRGLFEAAAQAGAGFPDAESATALLDAVLSALRLSAWLEAPEREAIRKEMATVKELLSLSGDT